MGMGFRFQVLTQSCTLSGGSSWFLVVEGSAAPLGFIQKWNG